VDLETIHAWIHVDDLCAIYLEAMNGDGAYNAINDTTNSVFSDTLAKVYGYKICPNVPSF
jgi:NAD dependent epimerase/dehydratase family enzyme